MSQEQQQTEAAVEAMLARLGGDLDAITPPNEAVLARIKTAVSHEINERWLNEQPCPEPSGAVLRKVKWAVHRVLVGGGRSNSLASPWRGALAAAAVIVLAFGLIRHLGHLQSRQHDRMMVLASAQEHVDLFVDAAQDTLAADEFRESILDELELIDVRLTGSSASGVEEDDLNDVSGVVEDLLGAG